jgi:hypothetical protein
MKIVKLDRRYNAFNDGYTHALRFDACCQTSDRIIRFLDERYREACGVWHSNFGSVNNTGRRTFWINFRNEADIALVLLSGLVE